MTMRIRHAVALMFLATPLAFVGCGDGDSSGGAGGSGGGGGSGRMDGGGGAGGARLDVAPADAVPVIDSVRVETPAVDGTAIDAPLPTDAPITLDGGAIDVALPLDAGTTVDTGKAVDAGAVDTGKAVDGAAPAETQAPLDGGTPNGG